MGIWEEIQQKLEELDQMNQAIDHIQNVMSNPHSTNEDVNEATQRGIEVLNQIEERRNTQ